MISPGEGAPARRRRHPARSLEAKDCMPFFTQPKGEPFGSREHICSQRPGPLVDESDCGLGILDHQNRQNRPENLLLHYRRIWRRAVQYGRRDISGGAIDLAAANDSTGRVEHAGTTASSRSSCESRSARQRPRQSHHYQRLPYSNRRPPASPYCSRYRCHHRMSRRRARFRVRQPRHSKRRPTISMAAPTADATCTSGELGSSDGTVPTGNSLHSRSK